MTKDEKLATAAEIVVSALIPGSSWPDSNQYAWMLAKDWIAEHDKTRLAFWQNSADWYCVNKDISIRTVGELRTLARLVGIKLKDGVT